MSKKNIKPPKFAVWILEKFSDPQDRFAVSGDLEEMFSVIAHDRGLRKANAWYWTKIIRSMPAFIKNYLIRSAAMYKNYLTIALRNVVKYKSYSFINVAGLGVGIASCLLILLYIQDEISYDRYNENADRIYRIGIERQYPGSVRFWGHTPIPLAPAIVREFPEVTGAVRLWKNERGSVRYRDKHFAEDRVFFADPNFFEIFSITLLNGDPATVLQNPGSVVITESMAVKYFGSEEPVGKILVLDDTDRNKEYTVTGVFEDIPLNSHFHFDFLASFANLDFSRDESWVSGWRVFTYLTLREDADPEILESKFPGMVEKYAIPQIMDFYGTSISDYRASGNKYIFFLQKLTDIHLNSDLDQEIEVNSDIRYIYLFSVVAFFILIIACINFIDLSTARSANRSKEVGIRKVMGSHRIQIIRQFLVESTLFSFIALIIAFVMIELALPYYNDLTGKQIAVNYLDNSLVLFAFIGFAGFVGLLAGSYPAFYLSAFQPVTVLQGSLRRGAKKSILRNGLVVFQFPLSIMLIVGTGIIYSQLEYISNKTLGYDKDQIVAIKNANALKSSEIETFKQELLTNPRVLLASGSNTVPGRSFLHSTLSLLGAPSTTAVSMAELVADYDFIDTYGLEIISGRNFSRDFSTDESALIINEAAVDALGIAEPVGSTLILGTFQISVIGVIKDFHFESLHKKIEPLLFRLDTGGTRIFNIRIAPENISETLTFVEQKWKDFTNNEPFDYTFLDEEFAALYGSEQKLIKIFGIFSGLAIVIACLGLFGLAAFTAEQRTREIGIRKVLGASESSIVVLLSGEFSKLVIIAFMIAGPIAFLLMERWLENFAYRVAIGWESFLFAGLASFIVAFGTVGYQAVKASRSNPVESLKYE